MLRKIKTGNQVIHNRNWQKDSGNQEVLFQTIHICLLIASKNFRNVFSSRSLHVTELRNRKQNIVLKVNETKWNGEDTTMDAAKD